MKFFEEMALNNLKPESRASLENDVLSVIEGIEMTQKHFISILKKFEIEKVALDFLKLKGGTANASTSAEISPFFCFEVNSVGKFDW